MKRKSSKKLVLLMVFLFIVVSAVGLLLGVQYINKKLLVSNENIAMDIAELVKNNFEITDAEVAYMKSLTFNEMEVDPINYRLMNVGNEAQLNTNIVNVYLVAPLKKEEIKYYTDESNADTFQCKPGTALDAIWLLNGIIGEDGKFIPKQREDIFRYTDVTGELEKGFREQKKFGTYSSDEWGNFITGYTPIFTVEGNFVGLLGIDMDPDQYHHNAESMIAILMIAFSVVVIMLLVLFVVFYLKYVKIQESRVYFDFYSRMSHDMRTPMNGIIGMSNLAQEEENPKVLHEYMNKIQDSGKYLLRLINDTLDVSKLSSGKMTIHPEQIFLQSEIQNIDDMIHSSADKKQIHFETKTHNLPSSCAVELDPIRFKQIFMNLLSNAVKYTDIGGNILFDVMVLEEKENQLYIRFIVQDNGIGMSEDYVKKALFKPFSQEHNKMSDCCTGSGLGLSITKNLVELMHGTIKVESQLKQGTRFEVDLVFPIISRPKEECIESKEVSFEVMKDCHVLICEDHPLNAEIARKMLEMKGAHVELAKDGQEGVNKFKESKEGHFDLILMDIRMPNLDGLEAAKTIRKLVRNDALIVPIIAMTANAYEEDINNTKEAGMNAHLSKPIEPETFYKVIIELLTKE